MSRQAWKTTFIALGGITAWLWLAGFLLMSLALKTPTTATPMTFIHYLLCYGHIPVVQKLAFVSGLLAVAAVISVLYALLKRRKPSPYGDARWASERDIRRAGLRSSSGVILGRFGGEILMAGGTEHVLCFAPTRSGKGVGIVVPNLLNWSGSVIVHDIKGENFELTSGFRAKHGQKVFFWSPGDPSGRTHCYNPLEFIGSGSGQRIDDIQKIAHLLLPDHEFWTNEARTLFVGLALYLIEKSVLTFGLILRTLRANGNFVDHIKKVLELERTTMHPVAHMALNAFAQKADKEQSAVLSTLNAALELWANPLIDAATARSDFDLRQLKKEPTTIYVGVSPNNLHRLRPLLQIFYQQAIDMMTERKPDPTTEPHSVLFLMDEFPSLGRMPQFEQGIAYLAGYHVRLLLIIQDIPQLEAHYQRSGMNVFMGNSRLRITFAANNIETAEMISRLAGTYGAEVESESESEQLGLSASPKQRSRSRSKVSRPLLLPQEILQLPPEQAIVFVEAAPPIRARKIRYFEDAAFSSRVTPAIDIPRVEPTLPDLPPAPEIEPPSEEEVEALLREEPTPEEMASA